jgi:hypothetical protein
MPNTAAVQSAAALIIPRMNLLAPISFSSRFAFGKNTTTGMESSGEGVSFSLMRIKVTLASDVECRTRCGPFHPASADY